MDRIQNLSINQPNVRAGDVRVSNELLETIKATQSTTKGITNRLLQVIDSEGQESAVFDGGFVACKEDANSTPGTPAEIEAKKEDIAMTLCKKIVDTLLAIPANQLATRNNDDRNPLITFSAQELQDIHFGLYDKYLEGWMSYKQTQKGKERMMFMEDVFEKIDMYFRRAVLENGLNLSLRLRAEKKNLIVYLRNVHLGTRMP